MMLHGASGAPGPRRLQQIAGIVAIMDKWSSLFESMHQSQITRSWGHSTTTHIVLDLLSLICGVGESCIINR